MFTIDTQRVDSLSGIRYKSTIAEGHSLLINRTTNVSDLNILMESAGDYMLSMEKAKTLIEEVKSVMKLWRSEARRLGLQQRDIAMLAPRFNTRLLQN